MAGFQCFEEIEAWRKSRELTRRVYEISAQGAFARDYGLCDQLRRASVSVMSNIAEGFERGGNREFIHFLSISKGSAGEIRSQIYVALDQGYIDKVTFDTIHALTREVSRMIGGLIQYLQKSEMKGPKFMEKQR